MSDNHPLREDFISHLLLLCAVNKNNKDIFKLNGAMPCIFDPGAQ